MFSSLCHAITLSPNFWKGMNKPKYIVLHTTEGLGMGAVAWFQNPASQVSAQYVILEDGNIVGMVDEKDAAWHAGIVNNPSTPFYTGTNPNMESIGIEMAGHFDVPINSQQLSATSALIKDIFARYGEMPVVKHSELDTVNRRDPGLDNYTRVMAEVGEVADYSQIEANVKATIRVMLDSPEGYNLVENAVLHKYDAEIKAYLNQKFQDLETRIVNDIVTRLQNG